MTAKKKLPVKLDPVTGRKRKTITFRDVARMMVESLDKLPTPVEFRGMIGKGKKQVMARLRKEWVGFGWVDLGNADGSEELLVLDDTVGGA